MLNTPNHVGKNSGEIPADHGGVLLYHWTVGIFTSIPRIAFKIEEEFQLYQAPWSTSLWLIPIVTSHFQYEDLAVGSALHLTNVLGEGNVSSTHYTLETDVGTGAHPLKRRNCCSPLQSYGTGWASWRQARAPPLVFLGKHMIHRGKTSSVSLGKPHKEWDETFYLIGLWTLTTCFSAIFYFMSICQNFLLLSPSAALRPGRAF